MVYEYGLCEIINFGMSVFQDPTVHTCILVIKKGVQFRDIKIKQKVCLQSDIDKPFDYYISIKDIENNPNFSIDITLNNVERNL